MSSILVLVAAVATATMVKIIRPRRGSVGGGLFVESDAPRSMNSFTRQSESMSGGSGALLFWWII